MYRYHAERYPIADDYGMHAVRSELNEYPKTPGELICQDHFASNFSILVKFKADEKYRFTLLNITNENGDRFSIVINMNLSQVILSFSGCQILQLNMPLGTDALQADTWHRIAVAVDLSFIAVYLDCSIAYMYPFVSGCTVPCDSSVEMGVLESPKNVMQTIDPVFSLHNTELVLSRGLWRLPSSCTSLTVTLRSSHRQVRPDSARIWTKGSAIL